MLALLLAGAVLIPNPQITPGVVRNITRQEVCSTRWGVDRRHVTDAMKRRVAAAYHVPWQEHAKYEFDHRVPRELGGADDEHNLWPESWTGPLNAHQKDRLENRLHRMVCARQISLDAAQQAFLGDWRDAYSRYVTPPSRQRGVRRASMQVR